MWKVYEKKTLVKELRNVPTHVLQDYEVWKRIVELDGLEGLRLIKGFHDEALKGEWNGYRSSRLNKQWRVIYIPKPDHFEVFVVEVNPHQY